MHITEKMQFTDKRTHDWRLVTAESVRKGHPDKFCDQLADAILDEHLRQDPEAHVAVEAFVTDGKIMIAGEVSSHAQVDYHGIVQRVLENVGYTAADMGATGEDRSFDLEIRLHEQSSDIHQAVTHEGRTQPGAGDQGIMVGYATDETEERMPLPVVLAHRLCRATDELQADWLGADGKAQVTVAYMDGEPQYVHTVVLSAQHAEQVRMRTVYDELLQKVILKAIPESLLKENTRVLINPSGRFVLGGPAADTGLTGRKLAVDQYGPVAPNGGGAFSGKDPSKTDRSGAYMARYIARNIVDAGLAKCCEVQIAYAIGRSAPVSVAIDTHGTGRVGNDVLSRAVRSVFDMTPAGIIRTLELRRPLYSPLACYGHFGRADLNLPWEQADRKEALIQAVQRLEQ